jgi:hypothetical protein
LQRDRICAPYGFAGPVRSCSPLVSPARACVAAAANLVLKLKGLNDVSRPY